MRGDRRTVVGYHGCDRSVAEAVVLGRDRIRASNNRYDWLGTGIYFWEQGPERALEFAQWKAGRGELAEPAVLGAVIHLGRCFDLADRWATDRLRDLGAELLGALRARELPLPRNRPAGPRDFDLVLRDRDCAVVNYAMQAYDAALGGGRPHFETVRGVFVEGGPAFEGAGIQARSHVQIAVRVPACISHFFLPHEGYDEGGRAS